MIVVIRRVLVLTGRAEMTHSAEFKVQTPGATHMFVILKPLRLLLKSLVTESTPRQMALGLAMGLLIGLVPKGNLLAIGLGIILAATRANLAIAAAAAVACMLASAWVDPVSDRIGAWVLSQPALQSFWTQLYNAPLLPWTDFNNSIVMGGFLLGLVLLWPVYRGAQPMFTKITPVVGAYARRFWLLRVLLGAEWADRFATVE
jgi:uncharacterized protein (TIGR03546 family)